MPELGTSIIGVLSSGVLTGAIKLYIDYLNRKREAMERDINERIKIWQEMSRKSDEKVALLEDKVKILQNHILALERIIIRIAPEVELPKLPSL